MPVARRLAGDEVDVQREGRVAIHLFYCTSVMNRSQREPASAGRSLAKGRSIRPGFMPWP
ncbi:MAG: hypothetical protein JW839_19285 [Candidatus Lokiarchaeota archaeon]|nr:hypothetical protein [Candidatus Lokiarchaeota archaeon]